MSMWPTWMKEEGVARRSEASANPLIFPSVLLSFLESTSDVIPLQRSQSLPYSATVSLSGTSDPHALGGSALSKREASRLDKFKQLLAGPNTDLGESLRVGSLFLIRPQVSLQVAHTLCVVFL